MGAGQQMLLGTAPAAAGGTAYRYWRITVTLVTGGTNQPMNVAEVELRGTLGGADLTSTITSITSDSVWPLAASAAFDDSTATSALSNNASAGVPRWMQADLGTPQTVAQVAIMTGNAAVGGPVDFFVSGSNDNTNFTTVKSFTGTSGWVDLTFKTFDL